MGADKVSGTSVSAISKIDNIAIGDIAKINEQTVSTFSNTYSLNFDGVNDFVETTSTYSPLDGGTTMSISVWIKPVTGDTYYMILHNPRNAVAQQGQIMLFFYSSFIELSLSTRSQFVRSTAGAITMDAWNHILCCVDLDNATEGKIYVDGVDVTSGDNLSTFLAFEVASGVMRLGKEQTGYLSPFLGNIDEFAIWNTDQRANVADIYNSGAPGDLSALAAPPITWWRNGDSGTFNDDSNWWIPDQMKIDNFSSHSFHFDGINDYVSCGNITALNGSGTATWAGWVKPENAATGETPFSQYGTSGDRQFSWFVTSSRARIDVFMNGNVVFRASGGSDLLDADVWNFVAITYNKDNVAADEVKVYVGKGGSIARVTETGGFTGDNAVLYSTTSDFLIGSMDEGSPGRFWEGNIDNVGIWDVELDLATVTSLYNSEVPNDLRVAASYTAGGGTDKSGDLQGYWLMGENAYWNGTNWWIPAYNNNALFSQRSFNFDGINDYIDCGNDSSLYPGTGDMSYSLWIKPDSITGSNMVILGPPTMSTSSLGVDIRRNTNTIKVFMGVGVAGQWGVNTGGGTGGAGLVTSAVLAVGVWCHIVLTLDRDGNGVIYINGVANVTAAMNPNDYSGTDITSSAVLQIGGAADGDFEGNIDDLGMWNTVLDANTVASIYNSGEPNDLRLTASYTAGSGVDKSGDLQGYWRMGEGATWDGSDWTIPDDSTNSNDGTSSGMDEEDLEFNTPGNLIAGLSSGMAIDDKVNNAPGNINQGLSSGMGETAPSGRSTDVP
jgi:hypothetical protein